MPSDDHQKCSSLASGNHTITSSGELLALVAAHPVAVAADVGYAINKVFQFISDH